MKYTKKWVETAWIVDHQYRKGRFNRMDMIMRLMCIEKGGPWWRQYRKMQHIRINKMRHMKPEKWPAGFEKKRVKTFKELVESMREKGYDPNVKAIRLDKDYEIVNGSHRLATAIHLGIEKVPIKWPSVSKKAGRGYSIKWFYRHQFSEKICRALEAKRLEVLKRLGLKDRTTNENRFQTMHDAKI